MRDTPMSFQLKRLLSVFVLQLFIMDAGVAADKTQAWGARMTTSHSSITAMRNRNKHAKAWIGEQARGWGQGSRITNTLTTSMGFHLQSSQKALDEIKSNTNQVNSMSASACGTCVTLQNTGDNASISGSLITSVNSGSVTSFAAFNN